MKILLYAAAFFIAIVTFMYTILFTNFGNTLLHPFIQQMIKEKTVSDAKLTKFQLNTETFSLHIDLNTKNSLIIVGNYSPMSTKFNLAYRVNLNELSSLKELTISELNGSLFTEGSAKGDLAFFEVSGISSVAQSSTDYTLHVKDFKITSILAKVKNAKLDSLLYISGQKPYAKADINLDVNISNISSSGVYGNISMDTKNGLMNSKFLTKEYNFNSLMPVTKFEANSNTVLNGNSEESNFNFYSNLVNINTKNTTLSLYDNSLTTDYTISIPELSKIYFLTNKKMQDGITIYGELKKSNQIYLTLHSKVAGGQIDAEIHNSHISAKLKSIRTMDMFYILNYPDVLRGIIDGYVQYDIKSATGELDAQIIDAKFTKNKIFKAIKKYTDNDLYKEQFNGNILANINREKISAKVNLKSANASIKTVASELNTKENTINSNLTITVDELQIPVYLEGDISAPKVEVDVEEFLKPKNFEAIEKKAQELFKKFF